MHLDGEFHISQSAVPPEVVNGFSFDLTSTPSWTVAHPVLSHAHVCSSNIWVPPKGSFRLGKSEILRDFAQEEMLTARRSPPAKASTGPLVMIHTFARGSRYGITRVTL